MAGCNRNPPEAFSRLSDEFVYTTLSFSPIAASGAGLHQYNNQNLDDLLDDVLPGAFERQRQFYTDFRKRLMNLDTGPLAAGDRADVSIIQDQISLALLE